MTAKSKMRPHRFLPFADRPQPGRPCGWPGHGEWAWRAKRSREDSRLNALADERAGGPFVPVSLDDLFEKEEPRV